MFLYVLGVADADFGISFRVVSTVFKIFATIEVPDIQNNHTTLVLSDIYNTFQSCVILFMTFCFCFYHSLNGVEDVN